MNRVLVCEPDAVLRAAYEAHLENKAIWVVSVADAATAIELLKKQLFHVCLWAVESLPDVETILHLKAARATTSVLVTSLSSDPSLIVASMRAGASNFWVRNSD